MIGPSPITAPAATAIKILRMTLPPVLCITPLTYKHRSNANVLSAAICLTVLRRLFIKPNERSSLSICKDRVWVSRYGADMPEPLTRVALRPATAADADLVFRITEACIRVYAEQTWGRWDEEATRKSFVPATHQVIQYEGQDIGCLEAIDLSTHIDLNKLYIQPAYRNRGIGTALMRQLTHQAQVSGKPIRLTVLAVNPARRFYERIGFVVIKSTRERHYMRWSPKARYVPK